MERKYHYVFRWHYEGEVFQRTNHYFHYVEDLFSACSSIPTLIPEGAILDYFRMEMIDDGQKIERI